MQSGKRIYGIAAAAIFALATGFAGEALAACKECGTVVDVKTIKKEGEGSGVGAVLGGVRTSPPSRERRAAHTSATRSRRTRSPPRPTRSW